jgi:hypothetical protein
MEFPGENLLIKMWETLVERGVGGMITPFYTPWREKRLALSRVEIDKVCRIATLNAEQEIAQIANNQTNLIGYESTASVENKSEISVRNMVVNNDLKRLIHEEINVAKAINYANGRLIEDDSDLPKEEVSQDWLNTWRDNASKVSDEEVQSLWGNLLAQEFLEPGRYSLRLLEFLRTMSKSDALLIEKIAPFISNNWLIYERRGCKDNLFDNFNIKESEIDFLEEIGILLGVSASGKTATANNLHEKENSFLASIKVSKDRIIAISSDDKDKVVQYQLYEVSRIGGEVLSLIEANINFDYVVWLGSQFVGDFKVEVFKKNNNDYELEKVL